MTSTSNPKGNLIGILRSQGQQPEFEVTQSGLPHERVFTAQIWLEGSVLATGEGRSKKEAEREAAEAALQVLEYDNAPEPEADEEPPVPIFSEVLAEALAIADSRAAEDASLEMVADDASELYQALLMNLGHL